MRRITRFVLTVLNAPIRRPKGLRLPSGESAPVGAVREPPLRVSSVIMMMPWRWFGMTTNSSNTYVRVLGLQPLPGIGHQ